MANNENLALNVRSGASSCDERAGKRRRVCIKKSGDDEQEDRKVQIKLNELRAQYQKTKMQSGVFAYFWYDPNHHYFHQNSQLTAEHARSWPANTGQARYRAPPGAAGLSPQMANEIITFGRLLKHKNTDVFRGAAGDDSPWLRTISGAIPPTTQPYSLPAPERKSMSNYMIVQIESPEAFFVELPDTGMDIEPLSPLTNSILGTYWPVVDCAVVATRPAASRREYCIPCDPARGETLYRPQPLDAGDGDSVQIPICMLWGVMPSQPLLRPPRWILTQTLGKMARSAVQVGPGAQAGPPPLWNRVNQAGAWTAHPFRQLVAAGESGDYAVPAVGCCYDDLDTNCSHHRGVKDQCIAQPNCTWNSQTRECLQGVFENSCANVACPRGSTRVDFSEHILAAPGEECCKPIRSCLGMGYSDCISHYHCNWDQEDERPRCKTRACNKGDCGGASVTTSVEGTAPNCTCICKAPAVGQNYCYVADAPIPPNQTNCLRRLSDRCSDRRPSNIGNIDELDDCIACLEEDLADDDAAGCTNHIRGLFCNNLTCSGHPTPSCPAGQTLKPDLDTTLKSDGCCVASCAGQSCPWGEELKPNPETIPRSQGCCIGENCEHAMCPPGYRKKANPATIRLTDGCCERVTYSDKRIIGDCDSIHHVAIGSNQEETCSTAAAINNGTWRNCQWDDNVGPFNDCDYASGDLGAVQLLPVGPLPDATMRPTDQKHVWYKGLPSDYNVVDECTDGCERAWAGGVLCSDNCKNKIDKYGRVCQYMSIGEGALICVPRVWNSGDSNAASMNAYTGGILSTPN